VPGQPAGGLRAVLDALPRFTPGPVACPEDDASAVVVRFDSGTTASPRGRGAARAWRHRPVCTSSVPVWWESWRRSYPCFL